MSILQSFEEYQKARLKFVLAVAEASTRPQNIEMMNNAGVMQLLRPLLLDTVSLSTTSESHFLFFIHTENHYRFPVFNRLQHWLLAV